MASKTRSPAPPLPPRTPSQGSLLSPSMSVDAPPPYSMHQSTNDPWTTRDPRTSSTQSLVPSLSNAQNSRRKLLMVYIHGFMGNETSFRSFPAHVHNLLTVLLNETHVVHTKVYPRYRSKKNIKFARDDFSAWLAPHESDQTDVVLLGHSMGGLLSAEVVLMPGSRDGLKHRILGTINFDVPFLGMHPGVVKSGLASIFKSSDEPPGDKWSEEADVDSAPASSAASIASSARTDTLWQPSQSDPNFNPSFANDVVLPMRKGWSNALHFVNKHSSTFSELGKATGKLVTSHLEFGGAMANYGELKGRYARIRALEEDDQNVRKSVMKGASAPRVRFVNYYTASTGRIKKKKMEQVMKRPSNSNSRTSLTPSMADDASIRGRRSNSALDLSPARSQSPRISLEEHSDGGHFISKEPEIPNHDHDGYEEDWQEAAESLTIGDQTNGADGQSSPADAALKPPPPLGDLSYIQDSATRKLVEKEHKRAVEAYEKAVKGKEKGATDQQEERREAEEASKDAAKAKETAKKQESKQLTHHESEMLRLENEKKRMEAEGRRLRGEPSPPPEQSSSTPAPPTIPENQQQPQQSPPPTNSPPDPPTSHPSPSPSPSRSRSPATENKKPQKERKFCTLPPLDSAGNLDPTWVRVFMENVDEVGAHCGLFFVDERYERLVGEVAERVEGWLR